MTRTTLLWILAVLAVSGAAAGWYFYYGQPADSGAETPAADAQSPFGKGGGGRRGGGRGFDPNRPQPVKLAAARVGDIDIVQTGLGTVTALNTVTVRSRVDGQLVRIAFREGDMVRQGDVLAEVDPRPFRVQLDQVRGQLVRDEALLANARLDLERYRGLLAKDSIARQQVDAQEALVRQYQGVVQTDRAQVDNANLQLDYARVAAPVSGRLGLRLVDVGNVVRAGDANGIVVITQTQPITVVFAIPADSLPPVLQRLRARATLAVEAWDREGRKRIASGRLLTADNQVDTATGTVKLKAEFGNQDNALFPNQFVNARLFVETRKGVTLVPAAAVQRGTPGIFVYLVKDDATVEVRRIALGPASGDVVAVESGIAPGERIVTEGADRLRPGAKIEEPSVEDRPRGGPRDAAREGGRDAARESGRDGGRTGKSAAMHKADDGIRRGGTNRE